jgi:hypothetical protein
LLIQASAKVDRAACDEYLAEGIELPPRDALMTGAIIGMVQLTDCVGDSRSRWMVEDVLPDGERRDVDLGWDCGLISATW